MDVEMPVMNGLEATKIIRQQEIQRHRPPVLIIGLSSNASEICVAEGLRSGMSYYLTKPCHKNQLIQKILDSLEKNSQLKQISDDKQEIFEAIFPTVKNERGSYFGEEKLAQKPVKESPPSCYAEFFPFIPTASVLSDIENSGSDFTEISYLPHHVAPHPCGQVRIRSMVEFFRENTSLSSARSSGSSSSSSSSLSS